MKIKNRIFLARFDWDLYDFKVKSAMERFMETITEDASIYIVYGY